LLALLNVRLTRRLFHRPPPSAMTPLLTGSQLRNLSVYRVLFIAFPFELSDSTDTLSRTLLQQQQQQQP